MLKVNDYWSIGNMWGICTKVRPFTGGMLPGSWDKAKIHFIGLSWHMRNSQGLEPGFVQSLERLKKVGVGPGSDSKESGITGWPQKAVTIRRVVVIQSLAVAVIALELGVGLTMSLNCFAPAPSRLVTGKMTYSSACFSSYDQDLAQWVWK